MSAKLNWGILGTGNIAKTLAGAINDSTTGQLVAVGSRSRETAEKFGEQFKVAKRYDSYDGVLKDPDVQAVYVSLPNHLHAEWGIKCAQAKKHVLLEKPFALNHAQTMQVLEAARFHDVFLMEAFMYRCHPQTARLAQLVRDKVIGDVRVMQISFAYNMGQKLENIRLQNESGGGGVMDIGCYTLSMARLIAGAANGMNGPAEPIELKGSGKIGATSRVDEWATATLKFPGDVLAVLTCANNVNVTSQCAIWGSDGHILVNNPWFPDRSKHHAPPVIQVFKAGQEKPEEILVRAESMLYTVEVDLVAKHINDKQAPSPAMTWADSVGNIKALDQWRGEIGLKFDPEKVRTVATITGRPLSRRVDASKMRYGKVEGIDKPASRIVMGGMVMDQRDMSYTSAMLDYFYEIGGNAIDTAYVYKGGFSERGVGQWIRNRGLRDEIFLIGKGASNIQCTPDMITRELLESLHRFGLDRGVDLYMMHRDNTTVPVGEFVDALNEHVKAGRMKAFGGSNWTWRRLQQANDYAKKKGVQGFAASSPNFSLARWNEPMFANCETASDPESRAWYQQTQMPLFAWSSQASGFFAKDFEHGASTGTPVWGTADIARCWFNDGNFERKRRVQELAKKRGVTPTQISLAYVIDQPINMFALIGAQNIEETRMSAQALDVKLTPDELKWLNLETP